MSVAGAGLQGVAADEQAEAARAAGDRPRGERRILTALCYDIVGSTELLERMDIEDYQDLISAFQRAARRAVEANAGTLTAEAGDGGLALFRSQMDARDAASLAIGAGFEIVAACRQVGREKGRDDLHVRIGIATSPFVLNTGGGPSASNVVSGAALAMATRLQSLAAPDTVLVSQDTRALVGRAYEFAALGLHAVKGFSAPQQLWRATRRRRNVDRFFAFGRRSGPLVGRRAELAAIARCWEAAVRGNGQVVVVSGEGGLGKSRIVHEVLGATRFARSRLVLLQCLPAGARATLDPLRSVLPKTEGGTAAAIDREAAGRLFREHGVSDAAAMDVLFYLLGCEGAGGDLDGADLAVVRERTKWALRRCLEELCAAGPLVLVVEDIHWSDMTTRQLLADAAALAAGLPAMLLVTSRRADAIDWPKVAALTALALQPLDAADTQAVIRARLSARAAPASATTLDLIERVSGGVPLFVEEICQWASENAQHIGPALAGAKLSAFEQVVEARLAAMGPAAAVARAAAVAGNRFGPRLVAALIPEMAAEAIDAALDTLVRSGFLSQISHADRERFGFRHALIQETIYKGLLRAQRRDFHARLYHAVSRGRGLSPWIGAAALAEHAEAAGLTEAAIEQSVAAGLESANRAAVTEARQLLEHALALCEQVKDLDRRDHLKLAAMKALGPVLTTSEGPSAEPARQLYEDGVAIARRRPAGERAQWFPIYWGWWFTGTDVSGERAHVVLEDLQDVADPEAQLQARHCVWTVDFYLGKHGSCIAAVDEALPLYGAQPGGANQTLFGGHDAKVCGLAHRGLSLWFGGRATSALRSLADATDWARRGGHVASIAHAAINSAMLGYFRRDRAGLRDDIVAIRELTSAHRMPTLAATATIFEGWCIGSAGEAARGRDLIKAGLVTHSELQTPEDYPVYCCMLAELMAATGESEEAIGLLASAAAAAQHTGHHYWLAEVHRRMARLMHRTGRPTAEVAASFGRSLALADGHGALPILLLAHDDVVAAGLSADLVRSYADAVTRGRRQIEPGAALWVDLEAPLDRA